MESAIRASAAEVNRPNTRFYEPELDVARFCAFLAVFGLHTLPSDYSQLLPWLGIVMTGLLQAFHDAMNFGVCMFFLLSSYLITKLLILEREDTGRIHLKSFYIRRILRIWPLYVGFLMSMWALGRMGIFDPVESGRLLAFLLFAGNIYTSFFGFTGSPISPLWSVSVEEQFYIVWPTIVNLTSRNRTLTAAAWSVIGISIASIALRDPTPDLTHTLWTSSFVQFQFFALGALLALRFAHRPPGYSLVVRLALGLFGLALLLLAVKHFRIRDSSPIPISTLVIGYEFMACGIVLLFLSVLGAARGRPVFPQFLIYLGKISYGLYVFHEMSLLICADISRHYGLPPGFRSVGGACLTLALAALSYRFLETPFLILKNRFSFVLSRPV